MGPRERVYTADDGQDAIGLETEVALSFPCSLATCAPRFGPMFLRMACREPRQGVTCR